jgi:hypothetical protein
MVVDLRIYKENELVKSPNETAEYDAQHSPA